MRECPHCKRPLSQTEKVCPVCAFAPAKKRRPYWIFVIAGLLIVIVILAVVLYYTLSAQTDSDDPGESTYEDRQDEPEETSEETSEEPEKQLENIPESPEVKPEEPVEIPEEPEVPEEPKELLTEGTYQSEYFYTSGPLRGYSNGDVVGIAAIDVSAYQTGIDWNAVADAGIQAAIIRVGYRGFGAAGTMVTDEYFRSHIEGALSAGLDVGVYFFSQATTEAEAIEEANYTMNLIADYPITYPVIFNWEQMSNGRTASMTKEQTTACAKAFCDAVEREGYRGGIYFNVDWVYNCYDLAALSSYILWCARYAQLPDFPYDFSIWQYSNTGSIPGIAGNVDLNIIFTNQ